MGGRKTDISLCRAKNQPHQISLALDLTALKFNDILAVDSFEIQFNSEWKFNKCKIGVDARSWDNESMEGVGPHRTGLHMDYSWSNVLDHLWAREYVGL